MRVWVEILLVLFVGLPAIAAEKIVLHEDLNVYSTAKAATAPKWKTVAVIVGFLIFSVGAPVVGIVWVAARYPDGAALETLDKRIVTRAEALEARVNVNERHLIMVDNSLENIRESQRRSEAKLDALLVRATTP